MTATLSSSKWRVRTRSYRIEQRYVLLLALLKMLREAHIKGATLSYQQLADKLSFVPDNEISAQLSWLVEQHIISLDNEGEYLLQQDLTRLSGREFYQKGTFKIPLEADAYFSEFQSILDEFWQPKDNLLKKSMDSILEQTEQ